MQPKTAGLWLALAALALLPRQGEAACAQAEVRMDRAAQAIDVSIRLPPGVTRIALPELAPYSRKALWQSPDGSARVEDAAIVARDPARRTLRLRMDVRRQVRYEDRAYPPYARFDDGTVVVHTAQFQAEPGGVALCTRYVPAPGEQVVGDGRAQTTPLQPDSARPEGYIAFGRPLVQRHGALLLVSDHGVPGWLRERVATQVPALGDYFTRRLGPAPIPTIFLYAWPQAPGVRNYKGDHLPGALTLALLGRGWEADDPPTLHALVGFLAHELFHSWNSEGALGSPEGVALLAKEGGAELARILATAAVLHEPAQDTLDAISRSYNACLFELPAGKSIAQALEAAQPGPLPYDCGVPLMYALAVASDAAQPADGYFALWRRLGRDRLRSGQSGYAWQDLMPRHTDPALRATLQAAIGRPDGYAAGMGEAWRRLGVRTAPAPLDADARRRYIGQLMATLMTQDCGGMMSFFNNPDGLVLDQPLPRCRTLRPGGTVTHLLGQPLAQADLRALGQAIVQRCAAGQTVAVGYAPVAGMAQAGSDVACRRPPPALPPLLRLRAPVPPAEPQQPSSTMRR
jgi:hypothetical protein